MMKERALVLQTPRLTLLPFAVEDQARALDILTSSEVNRTYMLPDFVDRAAAVPLFERLRGFSLDTVRFVYAVHAEGVLVGFINEMEKTTDTMELGYVIHPDCWHRGYATEALTACIAELFRMGYACVRAGYFEENAASARVMEKCGMRPVDQTERIHYRGEERVCRYREICREMNR